MSNILFHACVCASQGFGLGEITSDEDNVDEKKRLSLGSVPARQQDDQGARKSMFKKSTQSPSSSLEQQQQQQPSTPHQIASNIIIRVDSRHVNNAFNQCIVNDDSNEMTTTSRTSLSLTEGNITNIVDRNSILIDERVKQHQHEHQHQQHLQKTTSEEIAVREKRSLLTATSSTKPCRYMRAKSAETGLRSPNTGIVKKLSFNLEPEQIIPNNISSSDDSEANDDGDKFDEYFKSKHHFHTNKRS